MDILNIFYNNPLNQNLLKVKKIIGLKKIKSCGEMNQKLNLDMAVDPKNKFVYDNEKPNGYKILFPYQIEVGFVSNNDWKEFIEYDGYNRPELWLSDGWDFIKKNNINKPMYWIDDKYQFCLTGLERIDNSQPVSHKTFTRQMHIVNLKRKECQLNLRWNFFYKKIKRRKLS